MGRLVDIDEVIRVAKDTFPKEDVRKIAWVLCYTPTAYDVSKVVAELEEKAKFYRDRRFHHQTIGNIDKAVAFGHKEDVVRKSINIVRKGGVE